MTVEINVGPPVLTIHRSHTFMTTSFDGEIEPNHPHGVFSEDTRFVSEYRLWVNGESWLRLSSAAISYHSALFVLTNPDVVDAGIEAEASTLPQGTIRLDLVRSAESGRVQELFRVVNSGRRDASIVLELELHADFADIFEVRSKKHRQREGITTTWNDERSELVTAYENGPFRRQFIYRITGSAELPRLANGRIRLPLALAPGQFWKASGEFLLVTSAEVPRADDEPISIRGLAGRADDLHERWLRACTRLTTPNETLRKSYRQSVDDLGALRLLESDQSSRTWVPAAGVPWYVTLFGRDTLVVSIQTMSVQARFAEGVLRTLAKHQASSRDDWRDAQPGKIMHEIRHGELARLNLTPHTPYYGTWDATSLFLIALYEAWCWLGDRQLLSDLRGAIAGCLEWLDSSGDLDGDGFQEYRTFSPKGYENMSWKDARDSVVYPDGSNVQQPKALCELQGYAYAARRAAARIFAVLEDAPRSAHLERQADELKRRFNEAFWMEDEGTYAFALDPEKHQVRTIVSNPGHCLWCGIVDTDKAARVVERLLKDDMWSGWGVRTLSSRHLAYNPTSYQRGSVWPHDNGIVAAGMKRYGFAEEANRVAKGILDASRVFQSNRLPEVFAGLGRDESPFPVQYRGANVPQAWAAGSVFHLVRTILGLRADVPNGRLWVQPTLPDWLPTVKLSDLKLGKTTLHLRFWREGGDSRFAVESQTGEHLDVQFEPASGKDQGG